jgi:aromatic-amino-acid transaminase
MLETDAMELIASHQGRPSDDPIFGLNKEATARRQKGESIVNATIGVLLDDDGKLAIFPSAARAVGEVSATDWATYAPIAGTPDFLKAVLDDLLADAPELRAAGVAMATPGGSGALRLAITNYLEPGQAMLTTNWYWAPYHTLCDESDRRLDTFEMFTPSGGLDVASLDAAMGRTLATQGRALVCINDPAHNPTGYSMTADEWSAVVACIAEHAARRPVTLLVDCAYLLYAGAGDPRAFISHLRPLLGKAGLLFAWSASKSFTQYGLRVGALMACVADVKERAMVESALSYSCRGTWSNCNRGGLVAVTRMLADPDVARACAAERDTLRRLLLSRVHRFNTLARARGLSYPRYEGGFFVTVFTDRAREKAEAMRAQGVYVVPQLRTGPDVEGRPRGALRVALCAVPEAEVPRLVEALAS